MLVAGNDDDDNDDYDDHGAEGDDYDGEDLFYANITDRTATVRAVPTAADDNDDGDDDEREEDVRWMLMIMIMLIMIMIRSWGMTMLIRMGTLMLLFLPFHALQFLCHHCASVETVAALAVGEGHNDSW